MKKALLFLLAILAILPTYAQWEWHDPLNAGFPTVQNQAFTAEASNGYFRLPDRAKEKVSAGVWGQSRHSAGIAIYFRSDASDIRVRYQVTGPRSMAHIPATGVSGLDLYRITPDGEWQRCRGKYSFGDTISYTFNHTNDNTRYGKGYEFRLYLPLYNSVKWLEIGTPKGTSFEFMPVETEKPIVVYGTSIAQGACASRPGMAWTNILQRSLDYPVINLGFSGNGMLDPEVVSLINEIDGRLYILDCLPNLTTRSEDEIVRLTINAVDSIRSRHDAPIMLVDHIGYSNMLSDSTAMKEVAMVNRANKRAFDSLVNAGTTGLYHLTIEELALDQDCWVDHIHPSDLGMKRQADAVEKKAREILRIPIGNCSTTVPVTQRRDVNAYEWRARHADILHYVDSVKPRKVILGNSITHYWGGEPAHRKKNGPESWKNFMAPQGFANLGCGWDRIENVLWRVYHGELDGYQAEEVVLMIGTNNCGFNTVDEIVSGIELLADAVAARQPQAKVKITGILPRRAKESWVAEVNRELASMASRKGYTFVNPGEKLLQPDGKIDESLFNDGLHPNDKGYSIIAADLI